MFFQSTLSAQTDPEIRLCDSLNHLIFNGMLPIYDSNGKELALDSFYNRLNYESISWLTGDIGMDYEEAGLTMPTYPDKLRYGPVPMEFVSFSFNAPLAVLSPDTNKEYYIYDTIRINESTGALTSKRFGFMVKKHEKSVNKKIARSNQIEAHYRINPKDRELYQSICKTAKYRNVSITNTNIAVEQDACIKRYYLLLNKDFSFAQKFIDSDKKPTRQRKLINGIELYQHYVLQNIQDSSEQFGCCQCFIETDEGLWQIQDGYLVLYNNAAIEMVRYKILDFTNGKNNVRHQ